MIFLQNANFTHRLLEKTFVFGKQADIFEYMRNETEWVHQNWHISHKTSIVILSFGNDQPFHLFNDYNSTISRTEQSCSYTGRYAKHIFRCIRLKTFLNNY